MILFSAIAGALLVLCIAIVLWPLWRGAPAAGSRREANIAVFEQHTAELEQDTAAGRITQAQAEARRDELGARLLDDVDAVSAPAAHADTRRPWLTSAIVAAGFAALAIGLYSVLGDVRGLRLDERPDMGALVAQMKARVNEVPGDLRTRALLAQVQMAQRNYAAAARTLAQLNARLETPDVALLLTEARARVLADGGMVDERAQSLYKRVLARAPDNAEALWFAGLAALADGNRQAAIGYWQHLLDQDIPDDFRARVERRLAELRGAVPRLKPAA